MHRESMPSPLVAKELLPHGGSVSKLRSGEDWSWPREGGQGGERDHSRNMQRHGSDGTFRNIWGRGLCFAEGGINPLLHFVCLRA